MVKENSKGLYYPTRQHQLSNGWMKTLNLVSKIVYEKFASLNWRETDGKISAYCYVLYAFFVHWIINIYKNFDSINKEEFTPFFLFAHMAVAWISAVSSSR